MDGFSYFVLYRLPYVAVPFYLVMLCVRFWVWMRFYNPALKFLPSARGSIYRIWKRQYRPTIQLFPGRPRTGAVELARMVKGFAFFGGLWKRDKALWIGSWPLHVGLGLFALAHVRVLFPLPEGLERISESLVLCGSGMMALSGVYLLLRRLAVARVRMITDVRDYLAELALLSFSATAFAVALTGGVDAAQVRAYLAGLALFSPAVVEAGRLWMWHMLSLQVLLVLMPFSHLLHFGGIFLSRAFLGASDSFAGEFGEGRHSG